MALISRFIVVSRSSRGRRSTKLARVRGILDQNSAAFKLILVNSSETTPAKVQILAESTGCLTVLIINREGTILQAIR
jgi:hypothetical protein